MLAPPCRRLVCMHSLLRQGRTPAVMAAAAARRRRSSSRAVAAGAAAGQEAPTAAYVHLPFCKRKCFYCDFPVEAVGLHTADAPRTRERMESYVRLVCAEIAATAPLQEQRPLETVSFGGGTPSLVPPRLLELVLAALRRQYGIAPGAEVSLEADPGTFDAARLAAYRDLGVTRLSIGVQSFDEELLRACGRSHSLRDVVDAVEAASAARLPSWSLDLISGLPGLTPERWEHSLRQAVAAGPDHVSVYDLQVEEGTPFARWEASGRVRLPPEPDAAEMYELASSTLRGAGYEHYEISNYARPGHRSHHNSVYWRCEPYYAFGLGAASYSGGRRFTRPRRMAEYEAWAARFASGGGGDPAAHLPPESEEERLLDEIMLRLRLSDGLDVGRLAARHGRGTVDAMLPALRRSFGSGLMQLADEERQGEAAQQQQQQQQRGSEPGSGGGLGAQAQGGDAFELLVGRLDAGEEGCCVRLTDPAGFLLSNDVISGLFASLDPSTLAAGTAALGP